MKTAPLTPESVVKIAKERVNWKCRYKMMRFYGAVITLAFVAAYTLFLCALWRCYG